MKKIIMVKVDNMLLPYGEIMEEMFSELKNTTYIVTIKKSRNIKFHNKFFSFLRFVYNNQEMFNSVDELLDFIKIAIGYVKRYTINGVEVVQPKSISFDKMDEVEFEDFYNKVINIVFEYIIKNATEEDKENFINIFMGYLG